MAIFYKPGHTLGAKVAFWSKRAGTKSIACFGIAVAAAN